MLGYDFHGTETHAFVFDQTSLEPFPFSQVYRN
jgi:hypothetical protein